MFSTGDDDVERTFEVEHFISLKEGTRSIRQPPHRLRPEKEAEAKKQVQDLLKRGLIEPAGNARALSRGTVAPHKRSWSRNKAR